MRLATILLAGVVIVSGSEGAPPGQMVPRESAPDGSRLATLELIADTQRVEPGQRMWVAARFSIEPGWHLYWRNPGDSGLPPRVRFDAPEWAHIGDALWPGPERLELPGAVVDFIYEREVVLLFPVEIDAEAPDEGSFTIHASADWLVCRGECVFGKGTSAVTIELGATSARTRDAERFAAWRELVPRRIDDARDAPVQVDWDGGRLVVESQDADALTLFPYTMTDADPMPRDIAREGRADAGRLVVGYDISDMDAGARVRGVVGVTKGSRTNYWEFELLAPASAGAGG